MHIPISEYVEFEVYSGTEKGEDEGGEFEYDVMVAVRPISGESLFRVIILTDEGQQHHNVRKATLDTILEKYEVKKKTTKKKILDHMDFVDLKVEA